MSDIPNVSCPVHDVEFIVGSTIYINGERPRQALCCPILDCTWLTGDYCSQCNELIRTERTPERDEDTHDAKVIFAAYLCPICGYNNYEIEAKPSAGVL